MNAGSPSKVFCGIHLIAISQEMLKIFVVDMNLKMADLRLQPHLQGANYLNTFSVTSGIYTAQPRQSKT